MKNLWHFGDSYGTGAWGHSLARKLKRNHIQHSKGGQSNYQILMDIIQNMNKIDEGDLVLINWSFMSRGTIMDTKSHRGKSMNNLYDDLNEQLIGGFFESKAYSRLGVEKVKIAKYIDFFLENNFQFQATLLFLAREVQNRLIERGVDVRSVFIEKQNTFLMGDKIEWPIDNFGLIELDFGRGYWKWLQDNNYCGMNNDEDKGSENAHLKKGITNIIANEYKKRIENGEKGITNVQII
tara:strand:- start:346 stop:1059 length:714 start_codon:yes stop_codon:yes gene_type:complete